MGKTFKKFKGKKYPDKDSKNRKPLRSCLNHGGCPYCLNNRMHKNKRNMPEIEVEDLVNLIDEENNETISRTNN